MSETIENKVLFKCKHCENEDMRYFNFQSLEFQSDNVKNSPYKHNRNRETTPKIPVVFTLLFTIILLFCEEVEE